MAWLERNAPTLLLAGAIAAATAMLLGFGAGITFWQDSWALILNRRELTPDTILSPHNEHIVALPVVVQRTLIELFGMDSALPERLVMTALVMAAAVLFFVYARRRVGPWLALAGTALLLFLGPAWQILFWPFQMVFVGSVVFGLAALLALEDGSRRGDAAACAFLAVSVAFGSLGVAFVAAAFADVAVRHRERGLRRAYVAVVPTLLFLAWYLGWGHEAENHLSLRNVLSAPLYVLDGLATSLESLLGVSTLTLEGAGEPTWGRAILVVAVALVAYGQLRRPGFARELYPAAAATAAFWLLAAFNFVPGREPTSIRYAYAGAVFALLLAANLLRGVRPGRRGYAVAAAVALLAIGPNVVRLHDGGEWMERESELTRADLAAIEISARTVSPEFSLLPDVAGTPSLIDIQAGKYLPAAREDGSPAYTPAELAAAPARARRQADIVLGQALPLSTEIVPGSPLRRGPGCVAASDGGEIVLGPGVTRIGVAPGPPIEFSLRRFASGEYPVRSEGAPGGSAALLRIPADRVGRPWRLRVEAEQPVFVCPPR